MCSFFVAVIQHCDEKQLSEKFIWAYGSIGIRAIVAGKYGSKWQTWWQDRMLRAHILNTSMKQRANCKQVRLFILKAYFLQQG